MIPQDKLEFYVLNPFHDKGTHKARLFNSILGFQQQDWAELKRRILDELAYHESIKGEAGLWGEKYVVHLPITGLNGYTATVKTIWIIRPRHGLS